jgi:hypothetical protein
MATFTYFLRAVHGPIKIGKSGAPVRRIKNIEVSHHENLALVGFVVGDCERELHQQFQSDHIRGEWFEPSRRLLDFIRREAVLPDPEAVEALSRSLITRIDSWLLGVQDQIVATVVERVANALKERIASPQSFPGWPPDRSTLNESEAAQLLGLKRHQLRDRRLRGDIECASPVGSRPVLYLPDNLRSFFQKRSDC